MMTIVHQPERRRFAYWNEDGLTVAFFFPAGVVEKFETTTVYIYENSPVVEFEATNGQTMVSSVPFKIMVTGT